MAVRAGNSGDLTQISDTRRNFLLRASAAVAVLCIGRTVFAASESGRQEMVTIENFSAAGLSQGTMQLPRINKSSAAWLRQLSAEEFEVARKAATETPYSGRYWKHEEDGVYRCVCCTTALFDSKTKFQSGTGWPSFWQAISNYNVVERSDWSYGMRRSEVSCRLCDAHLGHVFSDGPKPTGLRYCMNSAALRFAARA